MPLPGTPDELTALLHETVAALVRRDAPDLTTRQLGVFLRVHVYAGPHTGQELALALNLGDGAVSDALEQLCRADLLRREPNALNPRAVLVRRTAKGAALFREIRQIMREAIAPPPED